MAPTTSRFLGGRVLQHALPQYITVVRHSIGIGFVTRFPATAPATSHFLGGRALRRALPLDITVGRHGIGIGFVTRFPATAPTTSHFLGSHGHGPLLLPPAPPAPPAPPPPYGCVPRHRHRLCHPVPHHGTRYLTLPRRLRSLACAATPSLQWLCAPAFVATHLLGGLALRYWLSHMFAVGLHSGIDCHSRSRQAHPPALAATPPTRQARASAFAASPPPQ